jgi:hypothetical protein
MPGSASACRLVRNVYMAKFLTRRLGVSDDPTAEKPSLHDCIETVLSHSDGLMDDVIQGLTLTVQQLGGKLSKVNARQLSPTLVDDLRTQAGALRDTFGVQLRLAIYRSGHHASDPEALVRFDDIQLLDERQLEANIEFALAQQEIQFATDEVLPPFNALISSLMGWLSVQAHLNPLRPETFARALRETLVQHVPSLQARTALIAPAAGVLGSSLRGLYKELAEWLRSQGVMPVVPLLSAATGDGRSATSDNPVARTMLTLDKLRRLLTGELDTSRHRHEFLHTVPASMVALEDLKMVESMMKRLTDRAQASHRLEGAEGDDGDPNKNRLLGQQLGQEVVRLMLENLAQDERLLMPVRAQVKELEPLLVQLAQSDPRFFSDKRHPARVFLDRITHQSLGFKSESDERFQRFLSMVNAAVLELLGGETVTPDLFTQALERLDAQWARLDQALTSRQEHAARALVHAEQRHLLAQRHSADFQDRLDDKDVPEFVSRFLCGPWAQVVAEAELRSQGQDDPQGYVALVDDLIWCAQSRLIRKNRGRLVQLVPSLLVKLRQGLQTIEYPPERIPRFLDKLVTLHEKALAPAKPRLVPPAAAPQQQAPVAMPEDPTDDLDGLEVKELDSFPDDMLEDPQFEISNPTPLEVKPATASESVWMVSREADEAGYLPEGDVVPEQAVAAVSSSHAWNVADLAIGSWVELFLKGDWVRAQLTWASPHRTLFMFISGKGLAHSMSRRTMEQLRGGGHMRIVSERHMLDNALDAVAQAALLNQGAKKPR